jgi:hypothetical protein
MPNGQNVNYVVMIGAVLVIVLIAVATVTLFHKMTLIWFAQASRAARSFGLASAFPSGARSYQALTFYPALTYGLDGDRIDSANFRIIGVGNRGLSGIVYRIKVACVCSKQSRRNAWGAGFGKIADAEFHARKIKWQPPISKNRDSQQSRWLNQRVFAFSTTAATERF